MENKRQKRTILIDLDGVLNTYTGEFDPEYIPPMKEGAKEFLENLSLNYDLKLFTTRPTPLAKIWLKNNDLTNHFSEITNIKKPAILQIDDRCINFKGDYTQTLTEIQNFKPWYKS